MKVQMGKAYSKTNPLSAFIAIVIAIGGLVAFVVFAIKGLSVAPPWVWYFGAAWGSLIVTQVATAFLKALGR